MRRRIHVRSQVVWCGAGTDQREDGVESLEEVELICILWLLQIWSHLPSGPFARKCPCTRKKGEGKGALDWGERGEIEREEKGGRKGEIGWRRDGEIDPRRG